MLTHVLPRVARGEVSGVPPRGLPCVNTCVSMTKMRKISPKSCQNDQFLVIFSIFSGRPRIT